MQIYELLTCMWNHQRTQPIYCNAHTHPYCVLVAVRTPHEANSTETSSTVIILLFFGACIFSQHTMEMGCFNNMLALYSRGVSLNHTHHGLCLWGIAPSGKHTFFNIPHHSYTCSIYKTLVQRYN